ncbi:MAG: biopolymer transporter ExbD [Verrucomicrobiia bacterium]
MRITSPFHRKHVRIEIIPLIDIMFFLLASFIMVSLNMTKIENIQVDVPSAMEAQREFPPDLVHIAVDKSGDAWIGKQPISRPDLYTVLTNRFHQDPLVTVYIAGAADAHHGDMVAILNFVRMAGIQKISFIATLAQTPGSASGK